MLWGVSGGTEVTRAVIDDTGPGYCLYRFDLAERSGQALAGGDGGAQKTWPQRDAIWAPPIGLVTSLTRFGSRLIEKKRLGPESPQLIAGVL